MVAIAVLGHGTVGSGVVEVLTKNSESINKRAGEPIEIKKILDLRDFDVPYSDKFTKDFSEIENDPEIKIVVECMGGCTFAYDYAKRALLAGKSVVTSNKEMVAEKGYELLTIAKEKNLNFLFEASVGGGIPIIRPLSQCMAANEVSEIAGILNGTTNYILTRMINEGASFEDCLKTAQELGYAERDPSADVDGHDACRKICILASLAFGRHVYPDSVKTEGIRNITSDDVKYCAAWGGAIKLIGRVVMNEDGKVFINVAPRFVPHCCQLSTIDDVFNGILVRGDATGDVVFYGRGAGKLPTASAVVADVIDCVKHIKARKYLYWEDAAPGMVANPDDEPCRMYIRASGDNAVVNEICGNVEYINREDAPKGEAGFITEMKTYAEHMAEIEALKEKGMEVLSSLRIFEA